MAQEAHLQTQLLSQTQRRLVDHTSAATSVPPGYSHRVEEPPTTTDLQRRLKKSCDFAVAQSTPSTLGCIHKKENDAAGRCGYGFSVANLSRVEHQLYSVIRERPNA